MSKIVPEQKLFPETRCYHSFDPEGRCGEAIYQRMVEYPFCLKHRCFYAQMEGLLDFQTIPLTPEQNEFLLKNLEKVRMDFQFELKQYKRFRPTSYVENHRFNPVFEQILHGQRVNIHNNQSNTNVHIEINPNYLNQQHNIQGFDNQNNFAPFQAPDLGALHNDRQNVHRTEIRMAQNPMLFDLLKTTVTEVNSDNLISQIKDCILNKFCENTNVLQKAKFSLFGLRLSPTAILFESNLRSQMKNVEAFSYLNPETDLIRRFTYKELTNKIMIRILASTNRNELALRMLEEVNEGAGYCMTGKITRLLNIFTGFPEFIQSDSRSVSEKIQDMISDINREQVPLEQKEYRLRISMGKLNVTLEQQQPWIDALREVNA